MKKYKRNPEKELKNNKDIEKMKKYKRNPEKELKNNKDIEKMKKYKRNLEELKYNGEELRIFIADFENLWNKYSKSVANVEPLSSKNSKYEKLYYFRNSFKANYPDIYETLAYSVAKEDDITVIKKIIELTLKDKQTNNINKPKPKICKSLIQCITSL